MSDDFYSLADKAMRKCSSLGTDFADIRFQDRSSTVVRLKEKNVEEINNGQISGISVRVLHKGFLGFSSSNNLNDILKVAENAVKIAGSIRKGASKKNEVHLSESRTVKTNTETKTKRHPKDVDIREKIDLLRNANDAALSFSSLVKSIESIYVDEYIRNVYINSEGSYVINNSVSVKYGAISVAKRGSNIQQSFEKVAGFGGFELFKVRKPETASVTASTTAVGLLDAKPAPSGKMTVVLHPGVVGLFAHEAVGHASEADHILSDSSVLKGLLGNKIASQGISIIDNGTLSDKRGYYPYDDEGVKSQKTHIIKNGILNSYLHTRETAHKFGCKPTGNARAQSFAYIPIPRMSNTYFDKGDYSLDEMISEVRDGLYLQGLKGGQVTPSTGQFTFGIERGYIIRNGKRTHMVKGCSLSGDILDMLGKTDAVGNDISIDGAGYCGKDGQTVPVDNGGPHVRVNGMLVGGTG